jgi:hypothetical protein
MTTFCHYMPLSQHGEKSERPLMSLEPFPTSQAGNDPCSGNYLFLCFATLLQHLRTDINNRQLSCLDTELQHKPYVKDCSTGHICSRCLNECWLNLVRRHSLTFETKHLLLTYRSEWTFRCLPSHINHVRKLSCLQTVWIRQCLKTNDSSLLHCTLRGIHNYALLLCIHICFLSL